REQTGCSVLWGQQALKDLPKISVSLHDAGLEEAIKTSLKGLPLAYNIHGNVVYVERELVFLPPLNLREMPPVVQEHEVTGTVTDSTTGEPLAGVTVRVKGSTIGTTTDNNGQFSLNVTDDAVLEVSYLGYTSKT